MVNLVKYIAVAVASLSQKISQMQVDSGAPISIVNGNGLHFKKIKVTPCLFGCSVPTFIFCPLQTGVSVSALPIPNPFTNF